MFLEGHAGESIERTATARARLGCLARDVSSEIDVERRMEPRRAKKMAVGQRASTSETVYALGKSHSSGFTVPHVQVIVVRKDVVEARRKEVHYSRLAKLFGATAKHGLSSRELSRRQTATRRVDDLSRVIVFFEHRAVR